MKSGFWSWVKWLCTKNYTNEKNQQKHLISGETSFKIKRTAASLGNVRWVNSSILVITQWNLFTLFVCKNEIEGLGFVVDLLKSQGLLPFPAHPLDPPYRHSPGIVWTPWAIKFEWWHLLTVHLLIFEKVTFLPQKWFQTKKPKKCPWPSHRLPGPGPSTYNPITLSMAPCPSSQFVQNPYNPIWSAKPTKLVLIVLSQHSGDPSSGEEGHGCLPFLLAYLLLLLLLGIIIIMIYNDI